MKKQIALIATIAAATIGSADDVYNFYFQKAPGPTTVIQGGGGQTGSSAVVREDGTVTQAAAPAQAAPAPTPAAVVASQPTSAQLNSENVAGKWQITVGYGSTTLKDDYSGVIFEGYGFGLEYNISRYFSVGAQFQMAPNFKRAYNSGREAQGIASVQRQDPVDFALVVGVTPFHVQLFGHDLLEAGLVTGVMSRTKNIELAGAQATSDGFAINMKEKKEAGLFIGPRVALNVNPTFGIVAEARLANEESQFNLSGRVRF